MNCNNKTKIKITKFIERHKNCIDDLQMKRKF